MPLLFMFTNKYRAGRIVPCEQCHFLRLEMLYWSPVRGIIYENFMLEHLVDKLGFLLKKKVAFMDPISWNRKNNNTQIISKRKFL